MRPAPASARPGFAPKRPILVTSFTYRAFANWEPLFRRLHDRGHTVHTALFPHISDPDHLGLFDLDFPNAVTSPIDRDFRTCERSEPAVLSDLAAWVRAKRPDFVFTCTFHAGPESRIRAALSRLPDRPLVIGLQHGMKHDWPVFERQSDRFDLFGAFGRHFLAECSDRFRRKMVIMGLPKLDAIARKPAGGPLRRILFAGQNEPSPKELARLLGALSERLGAEIVVRSHPEHRDAFRALATLFSAQPPSGSARRRARRSRRHDHDREHRGAGRFSGRAARCGAAAPARRRLRTGRHRCGESGRRRPHGRVRSL